MLPKLKFPQGQQRKYIEDILTENNLKTQDLALMVYVSTRTVNDWRREKFCISQKAVHLFNKELNVSIPKNEDELLTHWKIMKSSNGKIGGYAHFKKYGNPSTPEGRRKGGSNALKILRERGIIAPYKAFKTPKRKSQNLAEFVGIMLGDGGLSPLQASITLNSIADRTYAKYVTKLVIRLFVDKPTLIVKKDCNAIDLRLSGIKLIEYLKSIGLKVGSKVKQQVDVPTWIKNSRKYKLACLRGLMDTDGGVVISTHYIKSKKYVYYNICFTNRSQPLLNFARITLEELGLHPCVTGYHVWLYNRIETETYFRLVGSSNYRLLRFRRIRLSAGQRFAKP